MAIWRDRLPQLSDGVFVTDGGLETTLVFDEGLDLPDFAAFPLLTTPEGRAALDRYVGAYIDVSCRHDVGLVIETPTWRANPDWGARQGFSAADLAAVDRDSVGLLLEARSARPAGAPPMVISGLLGPRGDGYTPGAMMSADEARRYHSAQIATFAGTEADMVAVLTMNYVDEAVGVGLAAADHDMPVCVSFTTETDGRLPSGETLRDAIERTDDATTGAVAYYMINCAHPTHFAAALDPGAAWTSRIRAVRANASRKSHAELDESTELDAGDPTELGDQFADLRRRHPQLNVLGGCCGTDHRHIDAIARACR